MIIINGPEICIKGSSDEIGAEVTELIVSLKKHHSEILEVATITADMLIASGKKLTTYESVRRFKVEKEN